MHKRLSLGIAAAVAVLVVALGGAGSAVRAVGGGSISGTVYFDTDLDGERDRGEPPAPGRKIALWQYSDVPPYETLIDTDFSDTDGGYRVEGVLPDVRYWVSVHIDTETPCSNMNGFDYPTDDRLITDFGVLGKGTGSISGMIVNDLNEDGVQDSGESGLEGWVVDLSPGDYGNPMYCEFSDMTDYSGRFGFTNLPLLPFRVQYRSDNEPQPFEITRPVERVNDSALGPHYPLVDLRDEPQASNIVIAAHLIGGTSVVSGVAFRDLNLNTIRDEGESLLNCLIYRDLVAVYRETPAGKLMLNNTSVSCEDAEFVLSGVASGTYSVEFYTGCIGPEAPPYSNERPASREVVVAEGQRSTPVEVDMCPQAQGWYPLPDPTFTPSPTPTVTILTAPDVGTGNERGARSSSQLAGMAMALLAIGGILGAAFVGLRRLRSAR